MSCAEVSVWSILDYYGTRFPDFRVILPSEVLKELERHAAEQPLPTRGLEFGLQFSPCFNFLSVNSAVFYVNSSFSKPAYSLIVSISMDLLA